MRAPNLEPDTVESILKLIDTWEGPLKWSTLIEAIRVRFGSTYSRTALHYHARIQRSFSLRKRALLPERPRHTYTQQLRASLAGEREHVRRLEAERDALMETIITVIANASRRFDLSEEDLRRPLPQIHRASRRRIAGAPPPPGLGRGAKKNGSGR